MPKAHHRVLITVLLATALGATLSACGGGSTTPLPAAQANATTPQRAHPIHAIAPLDTIVGVGDSLTAGMQSIALLGQTDVTSWISDLPGGAVPPGQQNGYWALLYEQAKGITPDAMQNPATSPLPLIAGPGLGSELVPTWLGIPTPTHSFCDSFNQQAYSLQSAGATRLNPAAQTYDLGIPAITTHEALAMTGPTSGCNLLGLAANAENDFFYPVLENFHVSPLTEVNAAVSLHPTLATVWLGANDLLKYIFSGGTSTIPDSPAQMQSDIASIITQLQGAGARVAVANLPDLLSLAYFEVGGNEWQMLRPKHAELVQNYGIGTRARLTRHGYNRIVQALKAGKPLPQLHAPGSGVEPDYLSLDFIAQIQALNTAYNAAIAAAAQQTGAPLVDIHGAFTQIANNGGVPINPGVCCTLEYEGGLLSLDGLHPSNTGYAIISNVFIRTLDSAYGLSIPPLSNARISSIYLADPLAPH